jgi:hypothetical protein
LLDTPGEDALNRLARLAARLLDAPTALVSLVDADRQFFMSAVGLPEPWALARQTPLSHSFCRHAVDTGAPFVVSDAREHPLVRENPAIQDIGVVAYAGIPLVTQGGHALGTLCVIDSRPREWSPAQLETLRELAGAVMATVDLRTAAASGAAASTASAVDAGEASGRTVPPTAPPSAPQRPDEGAGPPAEPAFRRLSERLGDAADGLWRAAADLLERLGHYDRLLRTDKPTQEHLALEAQALDVVRAARAALKAALGGYTATADAPGVREGSDPAAAAIVTRAEPLRASVAEYTRLHERRTEVDEQFRLGRAGLREFQAASGEVERGEAELRKAVTTYEYGR